LKLRNSARLVEGADEIAPTLRHRGTKVAKAPHTLEPDAQQKRNWKSKPAVFSVHRAAGRRVFIAAIGG
jgi:hypothetical protein